MINNLRQYLYIIFLFGPISFVFFSCKTTEIIPPKTERLNQTTGISPNAYIYSLPKTTVRVTVEYTRCPTGG